MKALTLAGSALLVLDTAGCRSSSAGEVLEADGVHVFVSPPTEGWLDAAPAGRVAVVDDCLALEDEVVIWPPGTTVESESPLQVSVPHFGTVNVGDFLSGGGGLAGPEIEAFDLPESCASRTFLLFWPDERHERALEQR